MPTMVNFPTVVQDAVALCGDLCANEPERRPCAEYLTGRLVAAKKTVRGINRECVVTTEHSCLHRWLPEVSWDVKAFNDRRLEWWQGHPKTRYSARGVIALDQTLGDQAGEVLADVGWCWDHANERDGIAPDDLISNDVCPSGAHSPIAGRRCKKKDAGQQGACKDQTAWGIEWSDEAITRGIPGDCTFASYFTRAQGLHHLENRTRASVGDLQRNRKGVYEGREPSLQAGARPIPWPAKQPVRVGNRRSWDFRKQRRMPAVTPPVRRGLFWQERADAEASHALGSNRLTWEGMRMVLVYRPRWTGTETFHRDGKQAVGRGDGQGRNGAGQTRHVDRVSAADSLRMRSLHQNRPQDWARSMLTTIGDACRAVKGARLGQLVDWMVEKLADDHWSVPQIKAVLAQSERGRVWADCKSSVLSTALQKREPFI